MKPTNLKRQVEFPKNWNFTILPSMVAGSIMAEIEISVLSGQCLDRRIPDQTTVKREVAAWEKKRNIRRALVNWRFTTKDARIKHVKSLICHD
ncbi:Uncharacterised protein [uncultured archaeon]|nr:Uncharacterised protein [uncultured archaeon]